MKGLLDKAVQFATSDFGKDFFMGMDTGYSKDPKTLMQTIYPVLAISSVFGRLVSGRMIDTYGKQGFGRRE